LHKHLPPEFTPQINRILIITIS